MTFHTERSDPAAPEGCPGAADAGDALETGGRCHLSPEGHPGTMGDAKVHQREKTGMFLQKEDTASKLMYNV